jgi:sugar phosphate isomerase/epimerase
MKRREFLAAVASAPALWAKNAINRSRISPVTDEIADSPAAAIAFARQYDLQFVELRGVPGNKVYYSTMNEADLRPHAAELKSAGLKVSFLNSGMLKFTLPGTEPVRRRPETPEAQARRVAAETARFERRIEELNVAIRAADLLGVRKIRIFAFSRVAEPAALYPRLADIVGEMTKVAEKEGVELLLENEGSCNIATSQEMATFLKMVPSKALGINWDPLNGTAFKEIPYPDGYRLLPKKRIGNVQIKGRSILDYPQKLDWPAIFRALEKDGFRGHVGLETHIFGPELIQKSHESMREILRIVEPS